MHELPNDKLDAALKRFSMIEAEMAAGPDSQTYVRLAGEHAELAPLVEAVHALRRTEREIADARALAAESGQDADMLVMARQELDELEDRRTAELETLQRLMMPRDEADNRDIMLEIRAGTGGLEAALFAGDLFRMYERHAAAEGFKVEVVSATAGDAGGYKEIIAEVSGRGAFARFKFESGVHRVQRVPETEAGGRIHTSAATVAVLPKAEEVDVAIRDEDIRIDTMRASGAGGQHVNTTDSAVRVTHLPTGIVVVQAEKSQHQNRARAMEILRARLFDLKRGEAALERAEARRLQVGSGDRSERIRTYNFPQGRVTDHRINLTLYKLDRIMEGEIGELVDALTSDHQTRLLAGEENGQ